MAIDNNRLLMIGLDAGDSAFIKSNLDQLPNIRSFLGAQGMHTLAVEPLAGAVWPTFLSRSKPDGHGVYHHLQWNPSKMRVQRTHPNWIGAIEPFWRQLAGSGQNVTVIDVPFAFSGETNGALEMANWGSHDLVEAFWCSDHSLADKIRKRHGAHPMGFEVPVDKSRQKLAQLTGDMVKGAAAKAALAIDLLEHRPWDFALVVFGETHRAGHLLWRSECSEEDSQAPVDGVLTVYRAVDEAFGRLVRHAGPNTDIVLFSLHGMGPNQSQSHLTQDMLTRALAARAGKLAPQTARSDFGLMRELRRSVPASWQHAVATRVPTFVRDYVIAREITGGADWSVTQAISLSGDLSGYWRYNLVGREARGVLPAKERDALSEYLLQTLSEFTDEQGRSLIHAMYCPTSEGSGPRAHLLPDLVAEWNTDLPPARIARHPVLGEIRAMLATGRGGNHRFRGFYAHRGPRALVDAEARHVSELGNLAFRLA